ncbi:MAG: glycosyltransferase family 2 protein [Mucilaginibacter sp.]|nr:glycosyltransferase family 2 protein [Mucilaginibacter sp.]
MNLISIIIPIYNRLEITKKGLISIDNSLSYYKANGNNKYQFKIIIVDDGSTDGTSEWINVHYPDIIILHGDGNLWWTGAMNRGAKFSVEKLNCDYVLLWNDDTICNENYFFELVKILISNLYENSILVSKTFWLNEDNILFNFGCVFNKFTGSKKGIGYNEKDSDKYNAVMKVDWAGGMGTLIPVSILTKLNFFDAKKFPQYFGDFDFFLRAKENGYNSYAIPTLKIYNDRATTGIHKVTNFKDFKNLLRSNRSMYNLKQNVEFTRRHSNTVISWLRLLLIYCYHTVMLITNILSIRKEK